MQSFAKNAGLYGERVGALHVVSPSKEGAARIKSQLSVLARSEISNPPAHGARLVRASVWRGGNFWAVSLIDGGRLVVIHPSVHLHPCRCHSS